MIRTFAFLASLLLLAGCKYDELASSYRAFCPESATVPFQALKKESTCGGAPILIALARNPDFPGLHDAEDLIEELAAEGRIDMDLTDPATGQNALMAAIESRNLSIVSVVGRHTRRRDHRDLEGRHFLHYLARTPWVVRFGDLELGPDVDLRDSEGRTPARIAYERANYRALWAFLRAGANAEFLVADQDAVDPSFLFSSMVDDFPEFLDRIPRLAARKFTGRLTIERHYWDDPEIVDVENYGLAEYAAENCKPGLARYLAERGMLENTYLLYECTSMGLQPYLVSYLRAPDPGGFYAREIRGYFEGRESTFAGANEMGQNFAHFASYLMSAKDYRDLFGGFFSGGFSAYADFAAAKGWFDQADARGMLPLHYWVVSPKRSSDGNQLSEILRRTRDPRALNKDGDSILSLAAKLGRREIVRALLRHGLKDLITRANGRGKTPLDLAKENGHAKIRKDLEAYL